MKHLSTFLLLSALFASCNTSSPSPDACIDPKLARRTTVVTDELSPVCGCNGKTYDNPSYAKRAGVRSYTPGECPAGK